jgi:soluble lytic murein transglycosylase-like protein
VAAVALTVLVVHWWYQDRKRVGLTALAALILTAQIGRAALLTTPQLLPQLPSLPILSERRGRLLPLHLPHLSVDAALDRAARLASVGPQPGEVTAAVGNTSGGAQSAAITEADAAGSLLPADPAPSAAPEARAPWPPPDVATAPFPDGIEQWRPLVRQLLAEAWNDGRLDGPAAALDDDLVLALIQQESEGDPDALSRAGAIGLLQVMPFTFADVMTGDRTLTCTIDPAAMWDVPSNMRAGIRYLALAMQAFDGNRYWALAAYNAGIETVTDWRDAGLYAVPPVGGYVETAAYVPAILNRYLLRRPDVTMYVPDPMPPEHVPGALRLLQDLASQRPRPPEWYPHCDG